MPSTFNYKPYAIGLAVTAAVLIAAWLGSRHSSAPPGHLDNSYAAHVTITGAKVSAAESLMAGGVVYYDGTIENNGEQTLTGYTVALTFSDIYGKPLETDERSLLGAHLKPIPPHSARDFEIGFDKVPAGWNQAPPSPRATAVFVR